MRKVMVLICVKKYDKFLLVQEGDKEVYKLWGFTSGHLEEHEDIFKGAIREAKEETGYDVELTSLLSIQNYSIGDISHIRFIFNASVISGDIKFDGKEILNVKWKTIEEIESMPKKEIRDSELFNDIIRDIKNNKHYPLEIIKNIF